VVVRWMIAHHLQALLVDVAHLAVDLEHASDALPGPMLRREVGRGQHRQPAVPTHKPEVSLLMANQAQDEAVKVKWTATQCLLTKERVPEHHHHGPMGGGSQ